MKKSTRKHYLKLRGNEIIEKAEKEVRQLSEEEQNELQSIIEELQKLNAKNELVEEFKEAIADVDETEEDEPSEEEQPIEEEPPKEEEEEKSVEDEETTEEPKEEQPSEPTEDEEPVEDGENDKEIKSNINIMNKKEMNFSLVKAIRSIANNQKLDDFTASVVKAGEAEARKAGISASGQIQIPSQRSTVTVSSEGEDVVVTDILDILTPLRAKNVLAQAGAKFMTGLVGDVQVPVMSGNNVGWEGEISEAKDANVSFSNVKLQPHRLTAFVDISKQMIAQDSVDVENTIRTDLVNAINSKLEATILGNGDGKEGGSAVVAPIGMFNTLTAETVADFEDVCTIESDVEDANVLGECKYVMSNKAKAALRGMIKGTNGTGMVFENNAVDGTPAFNTSHVDGKKYIYGDWSNLAIGSWAGVDITVDPFTKASAGQIRIVVNCFFDAKMLREDAFVAGQIGE